MPAGSKQTSESNSEARFWLNASLWVLFLLVFPLASIAQTPQWGTQNDLPKETYIAKTIGEDQEGRLYILRAGANKMALSDLRLERYKKDLSLDFIEKLELPRPDGVFHWFKNIYFWNGQLWMITTAYDKQEHKHKAFLHSLDERGKMQAEPLEIDHIQAEQLRNLGEFDFRLSADSTRLLIFHEAPFETSAKQRMFFKVLNADRSLLWERTINLQHKSRDFELVDYQLDKHGDIFVLGKITNQEEKWMKGKPNFYYTLLHYDHITNNLQEYEMNLGSRSISDIAMRIGINDEVLVVGMYSNIGAREHDIAGILHMRLNPTSGNITGRGMTDFPDAFVKECIGEKRFNKGEEITYMRIHSIFMQPDGSYQLLTEKTYVVPVCYTDQRTGFETCNDNYYYTDVLVITVTSAGDIAWTKRVRKEQVSVNDEGYYSSMVAISKAGQISMYFNDNPQNIGMDETQKPKAMSNAKKSVPVLVTIDPSGKIGSRKAINKPSDDFIFRPKIRKTRPSGLILYGQSKRYYWVGRL